MNVEFFITEKNGKKKDKITLEQFVKIIFLKTINAIKVAKEIQQEQLQTIKDLILQYDSKLPALIKNRLIARIIKKSKEEKEQKIIKGYEQTPDGLLSPYDISQAGYIKKDGVYFIPGAYTICENNLAGHRKGQKLFGISQKYLQWQADRKARSENNIDFYIDKEIEKEILNF